MVVISLLLSVELLGAARAFLIWRWLLAAILLVNFLSIPLVEVAWCDGSVAPEHPMWISFARNMGALMGPAAGGLAELIALDPGRPTKVLDIAAGHGDAA